MLAAIEHQTRISSARCRPGHIAGKNRRDDFPQKFVDLLRRAAHEALRVGRALEVLELHAEGLVAGEPLQKVVGVGAVLQGARGFETVLPDDLVHDLPVAARRGLRER